MAERNGNPRQQISFFYQKSPLWRVIHADGALGGLTPRGLLHVAFYSERAAIPQIMTHSLSSDGKLGEPESIETKDGIVREMDIDIIMTKQAVVDLRDWLNGRIEEFNERERLLKPAGKE